MAQPLGDPYGDPCSRVHRAIGSFDLVCNGRSARTLTQLNAGCSHRVVSVTGSGRTVRYTWHNRRGDPVNAGRGVVRLSTTAARKPHAGSDPAGDPDQHHPPHGTGLCVPHDEPTSDDWQLLYRDNARPPYRYLLRLTFGNREEAEDHLQETRLRAGSPR